MKADNAFFTTLQAVTNTFLGDLLVLLIHKHTNTTQEKFSVFYRAVIYRFGEMPFSEIPLFPEK